MAGESPQLVSTPTGAVFLSYASQDVEAARRICDALRAVDIEVWFDQSELRGGDAWDRQIRKHIHDCALFIPVISANAHARDEGYFRLEWKLAVDRSHLMAPDKTFLLPVVIDATPQTDQRIPDRFRELQWSRLPNGQVPTAFTERVQRLLSPGEPDSVTTAPLTRHLAPAAAFPTRGPSVTSWWLRRAGIMVAALVILGALVYFAIDKLWISKRASAPTVAASAAPTAFAPPPHSIAVLPFVNLSGDPSQEYFSDGLTEELLNSLAEINDLQVAARTSTFYFKGQHVDLDTVAHKLNVAAVLEGSVRRSTHTVRVTAQLINAVTGFHLWTKTYDRDLGDVLKLQTEIATAVAEALKVNLLGDVAAKIELGGTRNSEALDAYLRGLKAHMEQHDAAELRTAISLYEGALRLDPNYALAWVGRSLATLRHIDFAPQTSSDKIKVAAAAALADASKAVALAPNLGDAHLALASALESTWPLDFKRMSGEYERAIALSPGHAIVQRYYSEFAGTMGQTDAASAAARRAIVLDPLSPLSYWALGDALSSATRFGEAIAAYKHAIALDPEQTDAPWKLGFAYYALGQFEQARISCEFKAARLYAQVCLAVAYHKLGRRADAEAELARIKASEGDAGAYDYATIYAQWGDRAKALEWLDTALRLHDLGLQDLKTDPLLVPLRSEPRFRALMRELRFPD